MLSRWRNFGIVAALLCLASSPVYAGGFGIDIDTCAANGASELGWSIDPVNDFTPKVMACIEASIIDATTLMLQVISDYMSPVVAALFTLAIAVFGIRVLGGEREIIPRGIGFLLRLAILGVFSYNLGKYATSVFAVEDDLINIVLSGIGGGLPWWHIDSIIGHLAGFGKGVLLFQGLLGLIGAALFSSSVGIGFFMTGVMAILNVLMFIYDVVFTCLKAYVTIGFMLVISPFIVPLGIFAYTERYLKKWIDIILAAMLIPVMLFAFLVMALGIFDVLVGNIFTTLGGNDFSGYWKMNVPAFSWLMPTDPNVDKAQMTQYVGKMTKGCTVVNGKTTCPPQNVPPVQRVINPLVGTGFTQSANAPGVDFGANSTGVMTQLMIQFTSLWLLASIIKAMVHRMPAIATSIAGVVSTFALNMDRRSFKERASEGVHNMKIGAGSVAGAALGGEAGDRAGRALGGSAGRGAGREMGGILGGVTGGMFGAMVGRR